MVAVGKKRNGMIDKTIICLSARANSGKTTSIRELFFRLTGHYPESTGDFLSIVQDKNVEHGIGISKAPFMSLAFSEAEMNLFRAIKKAFDPNNILNPNKMGL